MRDVVIVGYCRTAQSRARPKEPERDWFHALRADELLTAIIPEVLARARVAPESLDDFLVGCALGVTENWTFGGRTPIFQANLPASIPAKFLDMQCGSGMAALHTAFLEIAGGFADTVLACGMEQMTRVPMGPKLFKEGSISMNPALSTEERYAHWDAARRFQVTLPEPHEPKGCLCGHVLRGVKRPADCPLFGDECTPVHPVGACMVSSEGTCAAHYKYRPLPGDAT